MGPTWSPKDGFGLCCGFPVDGYNNGGMSNGTSGGSAISPEGWLFNICNETSRCADHAPAFPLAQWFLRLWEVMLNFLYPSKTDLASMKQKKRLCIKQAMGGSSQLLGSLLIRPDWSYVGATLMIL